METTRRRRVTPTETNDAPQEPHEPLESHARRAEPTAPIVARGGEMLRVSYGRVSLQVAQYSPVEFGDISVTVPLREGEDVGEVYDRWYQFLEQRALTDGRRKLAQFRAEVQRAKERTGR